MFVETRNIQQVKYTYNVSIPKYMATNLGLENGTKVKVEMKGDKIIITKEGNK